MAWCLINWAVGLYLSYNNIIFQHPAAHLFSSATQHKLLFWNAIAITLKFFSKMPLKSHFILMMRHVSALQGHPQATTAVYELILHAATACRCLRMYAHTSLTLPSYCGVHALFLLLVALLSLTCIPCILPLRSRKANALCVTWHNRK
jgi:hypothetical protein